MLIDMAAGWALPQATGCGGPLGRAGPKPEVTLLKMLFALVPVGDLNGRASFPNFSMQGLWTVPGDTFLFSLFGIRVNYIFSPRLRHAGDNTLFVPDLAEEEKPFYAGYRSVMHLTYFILFVKPSF